MIPMKGTEFSWNLNQVKEEKNIEYKDVFTAQINKHKDSGMEREAGKEGGRKRKKKGKKGIRKGERCGRG